METKSRYCLAKDGKAILGDSKEEVLSEVCQFEFDQKNQLFAKFARCHKRGYHSYSTEWSEQEKRKDAVNFLFNLLSAYGYEVFHKVETFG